MKEGGSRLLWLLLIMSHKTATCTHDINSNVPAVNTINYVTFVCSDNPKQFYQVKRMIRGIGEETSSTYSQEV